MRKPHSVRHMRRQHLRFLRSHQARQYRCATGREIAVKVMGHARQGPRQNVGHRQSKRSALANRRVAIAVNIKDTIIFEELDQVDRRQIAGRVIEEHVL